MIFWGGGGIEAWSALLSTIVFAVGLVGDKVKKFRKKKDFTQGGLARKADIPYTTLTKLESNVVKKPSVQTVAKIAKALDVSMEELIE